MGANETVNPHVRVRGKNVTARAVCLERVWGEFLRDPPEGGFEEEFTTVIVHETLHNIILNEPDLPRRLKDDYLAQEWIIDTLLEDAKGFKFLEGMRMRELKEKHRIQLFWGVLGMAYAFNLFSAISTILHSGNPYFYEFNPIARAMLGVFPPLLFLMPLVMILIVYSIWSRWNREAGFVAAGVFLGVATFDIMTHIFSAIP